MNYVMVINHLDAISRRRVLEPHESRKLADAIWEEQREARRLESFHRRRRRRRGNEWRPDEDETARSLRQAGQPYSAIADQMDRSKDAVAARLRSLRLREAAQ